MGVPRDQPTYLLLLWCTDRERMPSRHLGMISSGLRFSKGAVDTANFVRFSQAHAAEQ